MAENVLRSPAPQGVRRARDPGWDAAVFADFSEELAGQRVRTYSPSPDELKLQREERASRFGFSPGPALAPEPLDAVEATQQDSLGADVPAAQPDPPCWGYPSQLPGGQGEWANCKCDNCGLEDLRQQTGNPAHPFGKCIQWSEGLVDLKVDNGETCGGVYVPLPPSRPDSPGWGGPSQLPRGEDESEILILSDPEGEEALPATVPCSPQDDKGDIPAADQFPPTCCSNVPEGSPAITTEYIESDVEEDEKYAWFAVFVQKRLLAAAEFDAGQPPPVPVVSAATIAEPKAPQQGAAGEARPDMLEAAQLDAFGVDPFPPASMAADGEAEGQKRLLAEDSPPGKKMRTTGESSGGLHYQPSYQSAMHVSQFAADRGISLAGAHFLLHAGLPIALYNILFFVHKMLEPAKEPKVACVEYFAGIAEIHARFEGQNLRSLKYDIKIDPKMEDMCGAEGMLSACLFSMRCDWQSLAHFAVCCKSWVHTSRGSTMRDPCCIKGAEQYECVWLGNLMTCRSAILFIVLVALGATPMLEQPQSSLMPATSWFEWVNHLRPLTKTHTWMGLFDAATPKPTFLLHFKGGHDSWPCSLERTMTRPIMESFEASTVVNHLPPLPGSSKQRYSGTADLKETEQYTPCYARHVHQYWRDACKNTKEEVPWVQTEFGARPDSPVDWQMWQEQATLAKARFGIDWLTDAMLIEVCEAFAIPTHVLL